mgnify:FL=1
MYLDSFDSGADLSTIVDNDKKIKKLMQLNRE